MLFRGQNILGYKHYADDVVDAFCRKSIENGIDIIRIFDALNDVRNLEQAIKSTRKYGGEVEATMSYTVSPIHNEDYFVKLAKTLEEMGASAICVKDMANLLLPMDAYSLIKRLKETVSIPIHLHTHNTTGTGDMVNLMAAMAGVDIVDTALSPLANGTSQPATESLVATLRGTVRDTGLDLVQAQRGGGPLPQGGGPSAKRGHSGPQGPAGGHQHPALSGPRRNALQPDLPAQAGREGGQVLRRAGGDPPRPQGLRLSPAGDSHQPDRRHPGGDERHRGQGTRPSPRSPRDCCGASTARCPAR